MRRKLIAPGIFLAFLLAATAALGASADEQAVLTMVGDAVALLNEKGDAALPVIGEPNGRFHQGELYAFVYDADVNMLAHPFKPTLVGKNYAGKPDVKGFKFRDAIVRAGLQGGGWTEYHYQKPGEDGIHNKRVYSKAASHNGRQYIVAVGMY
ncbi:MAG: cache domain-containing protein [Deferrisomatales bacterium]